MEITQAQYEQIVHCLPLQRGNVSLSNLNVLNAILYVAEQGCKWRGLPKRFGNWHTIYTRMNRWSKSGVLDRVFEQLQPAQIVRIKIEAVSLEILRTIFFMLKRNQHYRDSATDYEALSVQCNVPRWIKALTKFGFISSVA